MRRLVTMDARRAVGWADARISRGLAAVVWRLSPSLRGSIKPNAPLSAAICWASFLSPAYGPARIAGTMPFIEAYLNRVTTP